MNYYDSKEAEEAVAEKFEAIADEEFAMQRAQAIVMEQRINDKKLRVFKNIAKAFNMPFAKVLYGFINQLPESQTLYKDEGIGCFWFAPRHEQLWKSLQLNRFQYYSVVDKLVKEGLLFKTKIKDVSKKDLYTVNFVLMDTYEDKEFTPSYQAEVQDELLKMEQSIG